MLKRFSFQTQVMTLPIVAGVAFLTLAAVSIVLGLQSSVALNRLEGEFTPAVQTSRDLKETLSKIQRGFQDAVAAMDEDLLSENKPAHDEFLKLIALAKKNPTQDPKKIDALSTAYSQYYSLALETSRRMILGSDYSDLHETIKAMSQKYLVVKQAVEKNLELSDRARQTFLVNVAQDAIKRPSAINIPIIVAALFIIIFLARSIAAGAVKSLSKAAGHLSTASAQLLSLAEQTETNMAHEASSVDETLRTMQEMLEASNEVGRGASSVLGSADRSATASKLITNRIEELNKQAMKISDISETVRNIADRSDVLALNASIEGAKAGEAGRGFALVAVEMRRLTESVTEAVREIKQLATEIQEHSHSTVSASEDGQKLAIETTETARRITVITTQQRTATEQVTEAMNDIQIFAQEAVNGAKQAKETANSLVQTANSLSNLMKGTTVKTGRPTGRSGKIVS